MGRVINGLYTGVSNTFSRTQTITAAPPATVHIAAHRSSSPVPRSEAVEAKTWGVLIDAAMDGSDGSFDSKNYPMNPWFVPEGIFEWDKRACDARHFNKPRDSQSEFFYTEAQYRLYRGGLDKRPMYKKYRHVSWVHLENFRPQLESVLHALEAMGLKHIIQLYQDWDESVIRQFYATLEVRMAKEKLTWMTGTSVLEASFSDLAKACCLDYQAMKQGKDVESLEELKDDEKQSLHYQPRENGAPTGLRRIPMVIWKILRRTIMPDNDTEETDLAPRDSEVIMAVMKEERLNIVQWMVSRMTDNRRDQDSPLIFQLYIMSLVKLKLPTYIGHMDQEHRPYMVYNLDREVLRREPSPFDYVPPILKVWPPNQEPILEFSSEGHAPMEVEAHPFIDISSDMAQSVASGHDSCSTAHTVGLHVAGPGS